LEHRFRREAEIAMALSHPAIAKTFHAGNDDEGPYLVQEFVDGTTLDSLILSANSAAEEISVPIASYIVCQIAGALAYLHDFQSRGLVHRDVTPDNIMLSFDGEVKLIDLGVAKSTALDDGSTTQRGCVGKPDWIAPELFRGEKLDRRADLFSLGLVHWYLLSGKHPGSSLANPTGSNARFAPPSAFNPEVPDELDRIVAKAIDPNPALRFQTADEFRQSVSRFIPPDFQPERELSALISRHTSSRELKDKGLALLLAEARPLLDQGKPVVVPVVTLVGSPPAGQPAVPTVASSEIEAPSLRSHKRKWAIVVISVATAGLVAGIGAMVARHSDPVSSVQPSVQVPSPARVLSTEPPSDPEPRRPTQSGLGPPPRPEWPRPASPSIEPPPTASPGVRPHSKRRTKAVSSNTTFQSSGSQATAEQLLESAFDSFERSDLPEALELAQMALKQGAGTKAYILIGRIAARRKDFSAAHAAFEQALRLSPGNPQATRLLEKVRRGNLEDAP
jgi:serine/threonine-protein kinase